MGGSALPPSGAFSTTSGDDDFGLTFIGGQGFKLQSGSPPPLPSLPGCLPDPVSPLFDRIFPMGHRLAEGTGGGGKQPICSHVKSRPCGSQGRPFPAPLAPGPLDSF